MRQIRVEQASSDGGSIATAVGRDTETNERLSFYGDSRMMIPVAEAIVAAQDEEDLPICHVEEWQVA